MLIKIYNNGEEQWIDSDLLYDPFPNKETKIDLPIIKKEKLAEITETIVKDKKQTNHAND